MKHKTRDEHLFGPGPKRILALDGGGIRGVVTLEYLQCIEDMLRERYGNDPDFRLCDYFDLIGGNSTGAIIAGALALGYSVEQIRALYRQWGAAIFKRSTWRKGFLAPKFPAKPLQKSLQDCYGDATLGSDALRTGIMIALKRIDTGSPWMVHNNPRGKYFAPDEGGVANRDFLLRQIVYASAAAPHFFRPERIMVAPGVEGVFIDGGLGAAYNPALHTLMVATLEGYGLGWRMDPESLLLISVGTGTAITRVDPDDAMRVPAFQAALNAFSSVLADTDWLVQTLLQWMSTSSTRWFIDSEIGDLRNDRLGDRPLFSYVRYQTVLDSAWLKAQFDLDLSSDQVTALRAMDGAENIERLARIGSLSAKKQVRPEHFPAAFDLELEG